MVEIIKRNVPAQDRRCCTSSLNLAVLATLSCFPVIRFTRARPADEGPSVAVAETAGPARRVVLTLARADEVPLRWLRGSRLGCPGVVR